MQNIKQNKIFISIVIVLVLALVFVLFGSKIKAKVNSSQGYSVVYLITGEVYVGKLKVFPDLKMKDGYIFQMVKDSQDPNKSNFQLQPMSEALWSPEYIRFSKENVIFYGPLSETSSIFKTLTEKK